MLYQAHFIDGRRLINQSEALFILAEGQYECQLFEVLGCLGATCYRIDFTRNGKLVVRVQARRRIDVLDALLLSPELRLRLAGRMKTVNVA